MSTCKTKRNAEGVALIAAVALISAALTYCLMQPSQPPRLDRIDHCCTAIDQLTDDLAAMHRRVDNIKSCQCGRSPIGGHAIGEQAVGMSQEDALAEALLNHLINNDPSQPAPTGEQAVGITVATFPAKDFVNRIIGALSGAETEIVEGLVIKADPRMKIETGTSGGKTTLTFSPAPRLTAKKFGFRVMAGLDQFTFTKEGGQFVLDGLPDFEIRFE